MRKFTTALRLTETNNIKYYFESYFHVILSVLREQTYKKAVHPSVQ